MQETNSKPFVFVLMPINDEFADVYELGIKQACKDAGAYCERVDEQIFVENILERVYNQIAKADLIIAEMTGRNPNVFYETGYAHALKKRVILLTRDADDIPFDLKQYPHVVYGGRIGILKPELEKRVRWFVEHPAWKFGQFELVNDSELVFLQPDKYAVAAVKQANEDFLVVGQAIELSFRLNFWNKIRFAR